jgi:hypothetical protein
MAEDALQDDATTTGVHRRFKREERENKPDLAASLLSLPCWHLPLFVLWRIESSELADSRAMTWFFVTASNAQAPCYLF